MLRQILFMLLPCLPAVIHAQPAPDQGVITYDLALALRAGVAKENPAIAAFLPEQVHTTLDVLFHKEAFSIMVREAKAGTGGVGMVVSGDGERHLINLKARTEQTEIRHEGRVYYTEKPLPAGTQIRYGSEQQKILGYTCNKATVVTAGKALYTVWYAPAIPYGYNPMGPELAGLKGAVLAGGNSEQHFRATAVRLQPVSPASLLPGAKARKITAEQLQDLQDEASESFRQAAAPGPGGKVQKRIEIKR